MDRYLVFDAGCSTCRDLADAIQDAVGPKLLAINIRDDRAKELLRRAFPDGYRFVPYLVTVDRHQRVHAWTGTALAIRLAWLMGPRHAWRAWTRARNLGISLSGHRQPNDHGMSRRNFLKVSTAIASALGLASLFPATPASAVYACGSCSGSEARIGCSPPYESGCTTRCGCGTQRDWFTRSYCYDQCGEYCYTKTSGTCCICNSI